jgi:MFS family permease
MSASLRPSPQPPPNPLPSSPPPPDGEEPPAAPAIPWPWRLATFRALRHQSYRAFFFGQLVSLVGTWVQATALSWLAYQLTGESRWTALVFAAQVLPACLLGPWGGGLADRFSRRRLIFTTQSGLAALAVLLAGLVLAGHITPGLLLAVAGAAGIVNGIDLPARLAFVMDMVEREDTLNAIALNSLCFNVARAIGPAVGAALLVSLGAGWCFLLNAFSFLAVLFALAHMRLPPHAEAPRPAGASRSLLEGFRSFLARPALVVLLSLAGSLCFFGWSVLSLMPALVDVQLRADEQVYGWLLSALGAGALLAALMVASFASANRRHVFLGTGVFLLSLGLLGLAWSPGVGFAITCCSLIGAGLILFFATAQGVMQLSAGPDNRGRVMGIWAMVIGGALPAGNFLAGVAADHWGVAPVLVVQALAILTCAFTAGLLWIYLRREEERRRKEEEEKERAVLPPHPSSLSPHSSEGPPRSVLPAPSPQG